MQLDLGATPAQLALDLVNIPSVSGDERALADAVEAALRTIPHLEVTRLGDAVVARTALGRAQRVILAGHLDTVPIKGNVPGRISEDGATLWGRGSVDMKAGVAVFLHLAATLTRPTRDITYVFYDHEEVEASLNGLGRVAQDRPDLLDADFAILGEPTAGVIEGGCNGTLRAEVSLNGVAAHSARAWTGLNAIHLTAPLLAALEAHKPATKTVDGLRYREGLNAVGIRGGIAGNVIPDLCVVTLNFRFAPAYSVDEAKRRLCEFVDGAYADTGIAPGIEWTDEAAGARPGLDAPIATDFVDAVRAATGTEPVAKVGWTDVARFGELGVPAVNFGPGDPTLAHTDNEACPTDQIDSCATALAAWLTQGD